MIKKGIFAVLVILLILVTWFLVVDGTFWAEEETGDLAEIRETEINLNYEHEQSFSPERARLILGVETEAETVDEAFIENNEKMDQIKEVLGEEDLISMETRTFRINPRTRREGEEEISYFQVTNRLEVKTEYLEEVGDLIGLAVEAGANNINSVDFLLADEQEARQEVLGQAMEKLEERAQFVAEKRGREEFDLKSLEIDNQQFATPRTYSLEADQLAAGSAPAISPGEIDISVNLRAKYVLE